jgi:hypothetical protein
MYSSDKNKHSDKAEIIKKLDKDEKCINLPEEYDVGRGTIYDVRENREIKKLFCFNFFQ